MQYPVVFLIVSLVSVVSMYGIVAQPLSLPIAADDRCEQNMATGEEVLVGPYPLQVTVTNIDYANRAIDFATEIGTFLHVTHAPAYELQRLKVGDKVELCIAEELHGDMQT